MAATKGNERDPSQETNTLYGLGFYSPHRIVNSRVSARKRGQGELSVSSSRHKKTKRLIHLIDAREVCKQLHLQTWTLFASASSSLLVKMFCSRRANTSRTS